MADKRVLVVNSSPADMYFMTALLSERGYQVTTASDGVEALEKVASEHPQLVILDIILPRKNGIQVCRQIKAAPETQDVKVLLMSRRIHHTFYSWGLEQEADEYIIKPFDDEELLDSVTKLL